MKNSQTENGWKMTSVKIPEPENWGEKIMSKDRWKSVSLWENTKLEYGWKKKGGIAEKIF